MLNLNRPNPTELAKTYAPFLAKERINYTALPQEKENKREKFERKYGMLYTGLSAAAGAGILYALYRGGSLFKFTNFAKKHLNRFTAKTLNAFNSFDDFPLLQKVRLQAGLGFSYIAQRALEAGNFIGNLNPFKDIAFDRFTNAIKVKPIFDKLTNIFTSSAKKLSLSKYERSSKDLITLQNTLQEAIEAVKKMPVVKVGNKDVTGSSLAKMLSLYSGDMTKEMSEVYQSNFMTRFDATVKMLKENAEKDFLAVFKEYKGHSFWNKLVSKVKECGDFIPAKVMESRKNAHFAPLLASKHKLSNSILDLSQELSKSVDDIFYNSTLSHRDLSQSYLKLKNLIAKFKEPAFYSVKRAQMRNDLILELGNAISKFEKVPQSAEKVAALKDLINKVQADKRGLVEEAVSACKVLKDSNPELYKKLLSDRNRFQKSFNEAVSFETDKTYRKLLDFNLHSLPTDFLTMGVGIGTVGAITVSDKKSRQEKISLNLQNGIPVIGGLLVSFLSNLRQVTSGTGAIFLGIVSGLILNRLGHVANRVYLKYSKASTPQSSENRPKDLEKLKS